MLTAHRQSILSYLAAAAASTASSAPAVQSASNSSSSDRSPSLEALIKNQITALESKLNTRATAAVKSELQDAKDNIMADLKTEVEGLHDYVCDQLAIVIGDASKDLQASLLESLEAVDNVKYEDLRKQLEETTQKLKESTEVIEAQTSRIEDLEEADSDQQEQLKQKTQELQETKHQLEEKQQELNETMRKLEEKQQQLDKERELNRMRSHVEKQGLDARVKRIEAALFGQKEGGELGLEQELDKSFTEVIPATSPTASPERHQEAPLRRARTDKDEADGSQLPTAKRGCISLSRGNGVIDDSENSRTLSAGENEDGSAGK